MATGQRLSEQLSDAECLDLVITNALILDARTGIIKADIGIKGGRIAGPQVAVTQANLFQDRDLPVLTDYRALIGGVLRKSYGLSQTQLTQIFPQTTPADLALV